jgi:hypothetical protein
MSPVPAHWTRGYSRDYGAGWHTVSRSVPDGTRLVHQPPYTPEFQPAETLWGHIDEPIVNRHFDMLEHLDAVVAERCVILTGDRDRIRTRPSFQLVARPCHREKVNDTPTDTGGIIWRTVIPGTA